MEYIFTSKSLGLHVAFQPKIWYEHGVKKTEPYKMAKFKSGLFKTEDEAMAKRLREHKDFESSTPSSFYEFKKEDENMVALLQNKTTADIPETVEDADKERLVKLEKLSENLVGLHKKNAISHINWAVDHFSIKGVKQISEDAPLLKVRSAACDVLGALQEVNFKWAK